MTVLVGYVPHKGGRGSLDLGLQFAHALGQPLTVVTVVPRQWSTPSMARVDAEFAEYAEQVGEEAEAKAKAYLTDDPSVEVEIAYRAVPGRSVSSALVEAAQDCDAQLLVLGSSTDGAVGRVVVGSVTDKLLHSSPIPLALSPRGYRSIASDGFTRFTCAYSDVPESQNVVAEVAAIGRRLHVPVRVASFGVRGATMYPPEVGLSAEDSVLDSWRERAVQAQQRLRAEGIIDESAETVIGTGTGWAESMSSIDWKQGEVLALGSSTTGPLRRVFLGSRATKLIRHAPVPVVVVPRGRELSFS